MCRDIANGGRRCPSHSNPSLVATRNAKRREAYAKSKGNLSQLSETVSEPGLNHSLFNIKYGKVSKQGLFHSLDETTVNTELGITVEKYDGDLVKKGYLEGNQISGVIDYRNLSDYSYTDFGFEAVGVRKENKNTQLENLSNAEVDDLTPEEKTAVNFFTSGEYGWLNQCLYAQPVAEREEDKLDENYKPYFQGKILSDKYAGHRGHDNNANFLKEVTTHLDSALAKGPKFQRKVYRGVSPFKGGVFDDNVDYDKRVPDYLEKNMKLGQEIVFDGYQSTSVNLDIAKSYAGDKGLLLEIVTSSGLHVTGLSQYDHEQEVILPRGGRYMVVGVQKLQPFETTSVNSYPTEVTIVQVIEIDNKGNVCDEAHPHVAPPLTEKQLHG